MSGAKRLDVLLVERGAYPSRARAQGAVKAGLVRVGGETALRPSMSVSDDVVVETKGDVHDYVSRGGIKLERALKSFEIDPKGKVCLDLGASTGGFTEVLLRAGAAKVYAVDVGTDQLHARITADPRVVNLEKIHAKNLSRSLIPDPIEVIVCDVSFISLKKALPPALALAAPKARLIALIKPQFEVGRSRLGKGGIVAPNDASAAACDVAEWLAGFDRWSVLGMIDSPILGGDGNKEFLIGAVRAA